MSFGWSVTHDVKAWSSWCFHARPQRTLQGTPWSGQEYFNHQGRESWTSVKGLAKVRLVRGRPAHAPASGPSAASSPQALMTFLMCHQEFSPPSSPVCHRWEKETSVEVGSLSVAHLKRSAVPNKDKPEAWRGSGWLALTPS